MNSCQLFYPGAPFNLPKIDNPFAISLPPLTDDGVMCIVLDLAGKFEAWLDAARHRVSSGELARAAHFHQRSDAARHLVGRALARTLLARALGRTALREEFAVNPWGKPLLPSCGHEFNIAHSGDLVCLALSRGIAVGIDVEQAVAAVDPYPLAEIFHPAECAAIRAQAPTPAQASFLRCWTRKEAVAKALGQGLAQALDRFRVRVDACSGCWLEEAPETPVQGWTCADLPVAAGYHASVAANRGGLFFSCHRLGSAMPEKPEGS